jgi:hypothetical protein
MDASGIVRASRPAYSNGSASACAARCASSNPVTICSCPGAVTAKRFSTSAHYAWAVLIVLLKRLRARVRQVARLFKRQRS